MVSIIKSLLWEKGSIFLGILFLSIVDISQIFIPYFIGKAIDERKINYILYIICLGITAGIGRFFWRYLIIGASRRIEKRIRKEIFEKLISIKKRKENFVALITSDIETIRNAVGIGIVILYDSIIYSTITIFAMIKINAFLGTIVSIPLLFSGPVVRFFGRKIEEKFLEVQKKFEEMFNTISISIYFPKIIKSLRLEEENMEKIRRKSEEFKEENIKLIKSSFIFEPTLVLLSGISLFIFSLLSGYMGIENKISLGNIAAFSVYISLLTWPSQAIGYAINIFKRANASLKRINKFMEEEREKIEKIKEEILKIFEEIKEGEIKKIEDYEIIKKAKKVGEFFIVEENPLIFQGTVKENITLFNESNEEEVKKCIKLAELDIEEKEIDEGGMNISGGQRKRLSLARFFYFKPKKVIFEKPLTQIDEETKTKIRKNIEKFIKEMKIKAIWYE